ncbi:hypothetical protein MRX96_017946 [Rhipicephalus microplus]
MGRGAGLTFHTPTELPAEHWRRYRTGELAYYAKACAAPAATAFQTGHARNRSLRAGIQQQQDRKSQSPPAYAWEGQLTTSASVHESSVGYCLPRSEASARPETAAMHQGALAGSRSGQIASSVYISYVYGSERRVCCGALLVLTGTESRTREVLEKPPRPLEGKLSRVIWNAVEEEADTETRKA